MAPAEVPLMDLLLRDVVARQRKLFVHETTHHRRPDQKNANKDDRRDAHPIPDTEMIEKGFMGSINLQLEKARQTVGREKNETRRETIYQESEAVIGPPRKQGATPCPRFNISPLFFPFGGDHCRNINPLFF